VNRNDLVFPTLRDVMGEEDGSWPGGGIWRYETKAAGRWMWCVWELLLGSSFIFFSLVLGIPPNKPSLPDILVAVPLLLAALRNAYKASTCEEDRERYRRSPSLYFRLVVGILEMRMKNKIGREFVPFEIGLARAHARMLSLADDNSSKAKQKKEKLRRILMREPAIRRMREKLDRNQAMLGHARQDVEEGILSQADEPFLSMPRTMTRWLENLVAEINENFRQFEAEILRLKNEAASGDSPSSNS